MSEWRCRNSVRANREHCTPITPERRKNQRFRLMKRVWSAYDTRCCVCARVSDRQLHCNSRGARQFIVQFLRSSRSAQSIRVSCEFASAATKAREETKRATSSSSRIQIRCPSVSIHLCKKIFANTLKKLFRQSESDTNRANRSKVIRF